MIPWILLLAYLAILSIALPRIFAKAGAPAWAGYIPGYNLIVWNRLLGKPWYWTILLLVPGINLLMLIIYNVNTSIAFNEREFKQHVIAVFTPWITLPRLAFKPEHKWVGPIPIGERKRTGLAQWGDAILFAVIVATTFRVFTFEAFTIPTESMEKSLLVGDYLFVSKLSYGARTPMTPITFPFTHHTLPLTEHTPSFTNWFALPYFRLPGLGEPERGDAVVFNFPEGDTVVANFQNMSYYQLVRSVGRKALQQGYWLGRDRNGRPMKYETGGLLIRPVDKQENYIKRCVAIAGDTIEVRDCQLYVNGEAQPLPTNGQLGYEFKVRGEFGSNILKDQYDISYADVQHVDYRPDSITIPLRPALAPALGKLRNVVAMKHQNKPRGYYKPDDGRGMPIYPSDPRFDWTEDNFGPLWVPKAGATLQLTLENLPLYRRAIEVYEHNSVELRGNEILINGAKADSYTFKQDYYWLMGDNRHRSQDARYWGFVPFDHVVGKAVLVWLSTDPEKGGFPGGIRWKRLFSLVR